MKLLHCLLLVGVVGLSLAGEWEEFQAARGRAYTKEEEGDRRALWQASKDKVEEHNAKGLGYSLGMNEFSDWTEEELATLTGAKMGLRGEGPTFKDVTSTPGTIDYRQWNLVSEVKNQGSCGSCWAFGATGTIEGMWASKRGDLISLSEQQFLDCESQAGSCEGGWTDAALKAAKHGVMREVDYPYHHKEETCKFDSNSIVASVNGYQWIQDQGSVAAREDELERALNSVGFPIAIYVWANDSFQKYHNGVYSDTHCPNNKYNHAVLLVGYNKVVAEPYWIVKNSWGSGWGESGYIRIAMGSNICGLSKWAVYPTL